MGRPLSSVEMQRHLHNNDHTLRAVNPDLDDSRDTTEDGAHPSSVRSWAPAEGALHSDMTKLIEENAQLRGLVAELERDLASAVQQNEQTLAQQQEFESLLEEKSEVIRSLHRRLQESPGSHATASHEEDVLALSEELERERRQLKEDEEALMQQMGEMEVQMSRERAELARQRSELQRLQNEIRHELELASRDSSLRERLAPLQRRQQEIMNRRSASTPPSNTTHASLPPTTSESSVSKKKDSGIFRRLFG